MIQEHTKAPNFSAQDQNGKTHTLSDYRGTWVLLYFYPKDDTPGCTKEACAIRDAFPDFEKLDTAVIGISKDTVESHKKFADKYNLPFTLLADPDMDIIKQYEAIGTKNMFGKKIEGTRRVSYLIDPEGMIAKAYPNVKPAEHASQVQQDIQKVK